MPVYTEAAALEDAPPATRSPETQGDDSSPEDLAWRPLLMWGWLLTAGMRRAERARNHFLRVQEGSLKQTHLPRSVREPPEGSDIPGEAVGPASCPLTRLHRHRRQSKTKTQERVRPWGRAPHDGGRQRGHVTLRLRCGPQHGQCKCVHTPAWPSRSCARTQAHTRAQTHARLGPRSRPTSAWTMGERLPVARVCLYVPAEGSRYF